MDVREVREALERLNGFTYHAADNQDAEDIKTVCAALSTIDPDAIRAEARAEALREVYEEIRQACETSVEVGDNPMFINGLYKALQLVPSAAILAEEPKEREADENNCPMIEAWVWPSGEWKIQAASAQQWKEHGIFQIVPIFSRAEAERRIKEDRQ